MGGREGYSMEELDMLMNAGFSAEFICRDLHAKPRSVARRLQRRGRPADAAIFDKYDRELTALEKAVAR